MQFKRWLRCKELAYGPLFGFFSKPSLYFLQYERIDWSFRILGFWGQYYNIIHIIYIYHKYNIYYNWEPVWRAWNLPVLHSLHQIINKISKQNETRLYWSMPDRKKQNSKNNNTKDFKYHLRFVMKFHLNVRQKQCIYDFIKHV